MYSSRVLRSVARASSSVFDGYLIPPRSTFDVFSSAGSACLTLLTRQAERDAFVAACNDGVINPPVLGQANFGMFMMLALHNDLNSPLFKKHGFVVDEFIEGAKPALERFHEVQITLQEGLQREDAEGEEEKEEEASAAEPDGSGKPASGSEGGESSSAGVSSNKSVDDAPSAEAIFRALNGIGGTPGELDGADGGGVMRLMKRSWADEAEADPDSPAAQLRAMLTREYFDAIELSAKTKYLLEKKMNITEGSGEISNMALLSARAMELPSETDDDKDDGPMSDDSLDDERIEDRPVAAQVEILYDIEQTFKAKEGDADAEEAMKAQGLTSPRKSVLVGVFQGFLHKDPEGHDSIRWKLALNRPAWEFPYLFSG